MCFIRWTTKWLEQSASCRCIGWYLFEKYYRNIVTTEIDLGNIGAEDRVLCIGGGSVPATAIVIAQKTMASVTVIDIDADAVNRANKVIKKLKLTDLIDVIQAGGEEICPKDFSVVHIARQVFPQKRVLQSVWLRSIRGTRILVRQQNDRGLLARLVRKMNATTLLVR